MAIILFALVQSRNEACKPVAWIYFEIRFTLTLFWKNFKNSTKSLKVALKMKKKTKVLLMLFYRLFDCPEVNFGPLSTFTPWKEWRGIWKIYFPVKNGFSVKKFFWTILGPQMMACINSGYNISIRASVHLCKFVSPSLGCQEYSRRLFYIYRKASWKIVITFGSHTTWSCVYIHW